MKLYELRFRSGDTLNPRQSSALKSESDLGSAAEVNDESLDADTRHLARAPGFLAFGPCSTVWLKVAWLQSCRLKQVEPTLN